MVTTSSTLTGSGTAVTAGTAGVDDLPRFLGVGPSPAPTDTTRTFLEKDSDNVRAAQCALKRKIAHYLVYKGANFPAKPYFHNNRTITFLEIEQVNMAFLCNIIN